MARRQRQSTCFAADVSRKIRACIGERAANHNALLLQPTMSKLDMATALKIFLPEEDRQMALTTHRRYYDVLSSSAYRIYLNGVGNAWKVRFRWHTADALGRRDCFAMPSTGPVYRYDFQPSDFTIELLTVLEEYVDNATKWGLVSDVFGWLNNYIVKPRDYAHMLFLMPALRPILVDVCGSGFVESIKPLRSLRLPVSAEELQHLQRANSFLAASYLLPRNNGNGEGLIYMSVEFANEPTLEGWNGEITPLLQK